MIKTIKLTEYNINSIISNFFDIEIEINNDFEDQLILTCDNDSDFNKLNFSISNNSIELSSNGEISNSMNNVIISGNNSGIIINSKNISNNHSNSLKVKLFLNNLSLIKNYGVGNINLKSNQMIQDLDVLNMSVGDIYISSYIKNLNLENKGVGNINCSNSLAEVANVTLSGIGNILVKAISYNSIKLVGIGNIECYFKQSISKTNISGIGKLITKELKDYNTNLFDTSEPEIINPTKTNKTNIISSSLNTFKNKIKKLL